MNGGYINIDCKGLDLTKGSTAQTITGIFSDVVVAMGTGKPLFAYGCKWGTLDITPIQVFAIRFSESMIICTSSTLQVVIKSDDTITINNMVGGE